MSGQKIRTLLIEDHEIIRLGLRKMLVHLADIEIVAEAGSGSSAIEKIIETRPELVLVDIGLPDIDGIQITSLLKQSSDTKVIVITSHSHQDDIAAALSAGADGYCLKGISKEHLFICIRSVINGAKWLDPQIAGQLAQLVSPPRKNDENESKKGNTAKRYSLSERELEILTLVVDGNSNQQMADKLYLSPETIKTHMRHIMEKLQVADRTQAAVKAIREAIVIAKITAA